MERSRSFKERGIFMSNEVFSCVANEVYSFVARLFRLMD